MNLPKLTFLTFFLISFAHSEIPAAEVWENNTPGAFLKRIEIYHHDDGIIPDNLLEPITGLMDITFQNDTKILGLALRSIDGASNPSFLGSINANYTQYTVYHCEAAATGSICDGIALRLEDGRLCAGVFQYLTLLNRVAEASIADIGCFTRLAIISSPRVHKEILQKYTKEQLIDIIFGVHPIKPIGPICITCPLWDGYKKEITEKLKELKAKRYKIEIKEVN